MLLRLPSHHSPPPPPLTSPDMRRVQRPTEGRRGGAVCRAGRPGPVLAPGLLYLLRVQGAAGRPHLLLQRVEAEALLRAAPRRERKTSLRCLRRGMHTVPAIRTLLLYSMVYSLSTLSIAFTLSSPCSLLFSLSWSSFVVCSLIHIISLGCCL